MEQQAKDWGGESLDAVMTPAKTRVQLEKEEWEARRAAEAAAAADGEAAPAAVAPADAHRSSGASEGGDEAGAEAEEGEPAPADDLADEFGGMTLEELEAALAAAEAEAAAALAAAEAGDGSGYVTSAAGFAGLSLADLQKRKSRWAMCVASWFSGRPAGLQR